MAKTKKSVDELKWRKTELQRLRREKLKNNPDAYEREKQKERERYHRRKSQNKIKTIKQLTPRQQRIKKKIWRNSSKRYREKQKEKQRSIDQYINENTPPSTPEPGPSQLQVVVLPSRQSRVGRKIVKKNRAKVHRDNQKLKSHLMKAEAKARKYKNRYFRLKNKIKRNSPMTKVNTLLKGHVVSAEVKKKLLFHEALVSQISTNYSNLPKKKSTQKYFRDVLTGKILKKYKCMGELNFMSYKVKRSRRYNKTTALKNIQALRLRVQDFLEKDINSKLCPGKKDTVTRHKLKKQKRLLNKTLIQLYDDFRKENAIFLSYSTFCKLKPFWIVHPNVNRRDTCLCTVCENGELLIRRLKILNIINENCLDKVCKSMCCPEDMLEKCLNRLCNKCNKKELEITAYNPDDVSFYEKWVSKTVDVNIKGYIKRCKKTIKEQIQCTKRNIVDELNKQIPNLFKHISNRNHQYKAIDYIKKYITDNSAVIHVDFSENFACKYANEIQSMHFGGSRQQLSLHTVVFYYQNKEDGIIVSESLRHDPVAILVHLQPVFDVISLRVPNLSILHFVSDGPSTQYRNCKMFYIIGSRIKNNFQNLRSITWNYTERGHGKGAPDGVGGVIKRIADRLVAMGQDIENIDKFLELIKGMVKNISLIKVSQEQIDNNLSLPSNIQPFKGTLQAHQVTWSQEKPHILQIRRLTCNECTTNKNCDHYHIGEYKIPLQLDPESFHVSNQEDECNLGSPSNIYEDRKINGILFVYSLLL
ncbi:hypothetical protein RI129_003288 [Pyrocoelia pectoralis]|uniref:Uncharacterized protein n=1 Tax=Pyrocoelia pectoralis TaxID=417401 RepID=A0AAN7ZUD9_9COLE